MTFEVAGMAPLIQVYDMKEAVAFYRDALGFGIVSSSEEIEAPEGRYFHWCWLRLGGADLMLNTAHDAGERPAERDPARQEAHRDTGLFFDCPDVDPAAAHLRSKGIEVEGRRPRLTACASSGCAIPTAICCASRRGLERDRPISGRPASERDLAPTTATP